MNVCETLVEDRNTELKKPVCVPLRPPQIPHWLAWDRTGGFMMTAR